MVSYRGKPGGLPRAPENRPAGADGQERTPVPIPEIIKYNREDATRMNLMDTKTGQNLKKALEGEALACAKYHFFADKARLEGQKEVAELFEKMAANETAHAGVWYKLLCGGTVGGSMQNLTVSANAEFGEWSSMYPSFAEQAKEEGLDGIAAMFEKIAAIEKDHERQFMEAMVALGSGTQPSEEQQEMEKRMEERVKVLVPGHRCVVCGSVYEQRPDVCEVCGAIGFFENCRMESR